MYTVVEVGMVITVVSVHGTDDEALQPEELHCGGGEDMDDGELLSVEEAGIEGTPVMYMTWLIVEVITSWMTVVTLM